MQNLLNWDFGLGLQTLGGQGILEESTIQTMTAPCLISPLPHYAKGWFVNDWPNWWHTGVLSGTASIMVRTATGLCWAALANTYAEGILPSLDRLMWDMVAAVPAWRASNVRGPSSSIRAEQRAYAQTAGSHLLCRQTPSALQFGPKPTIGAEGEI